MQSLHARKLMKCNRYHNAELLKYAIRNVSDNLLRFLQFPFSHWSSWWKRCWHGPLWSRKRLHFWRWRGWITIVLNSSFVTPGRPYSRFWFSRRLNCNSQTVTPLPFKRTHKINSLTDWAHLISLINWSQIVSFLVNSTPASRISTFFLKCRPYPFFRRCILSVYDRLK